MILNAINHKTHIVVTVKTAVALAAAPTVPNEAMGRRVDVPLVIGFTWGCLSVDLRCVQWREGCRFGDFLVRCSVFCDY